MVQDEISIGGCKHIIQNSTLIVQRNEDKVLRFHILYATAIGNSFLLMHNNARLHAARVDL